MGWDAYLQRESVGVWKWEEWSVLSDVLAAVLQILVLVDRDKR